MLQLEDLNDAELLRALWARYEVKQIYTWVGSVLVSVNPYHDIGAFCEEVEADYASDHAPRAPHLYATVRAALAAPGNRHALLITGESGAGKSEATRAVISFLARNRSSADSTQERLMRSTPVLDAFGNAHTRQNMNSSRYGKFIEVHLSAESEITGATLRPYMLEASRVAGELPHGEHTYHIFYLLQAALGALAGGSAPLTPFWARLSRAPEWTELVELGGTYFRTSSRLACGPPAGRCVEWFEVIFEGLVGAGMQHAEVAECCRIVAAVALLADAEVGNAAMGSAAALLRIPEKDIQVFLTQAETSAGATKKERFYRARTEREVATLRASFAQELYAALFGWLTRLVARGIAPPKKAPAARMLGLLDLYGFEVFAANGFEQFLINYCNERLQQFFNRQVFTCEAEEYAAEGLDADGQWMALTRACQLPALTLLEGEPGSSQGVFGIINDRARCGFEDSGGGGGCNSGRALVDSIAAKYSGHAAFCRAGRGSSRVFGVKHFAGEVFYEVTHFVRKNASAHRPDIVGFLRERGGPFIREVLSEDADGELDEALRCGDPPGAGLPGPAAPGAAGGGHQRRKLFGRTLISVFQQELNELCTALQARQCRHVRCLRPNDQQAPLVFDDASMLRQCRYSGLFEATRIRRQGYAHRRPLRTFVARYALLLDTGEAKQAARHAGDAGAFAACGSICEAVLSGRAAGAEAGVSPDDLRIGRTKVFLRETAFMQLESMRAQVAARTITAALRGHCTRQYFLRLVYAVILAQACTRGRAARAWVRQIRPAILAERERAAAEARAAAHAAELARAHEAARRLQLRWRNWAAARRRERARRQEEELRMQRLQRQGELELQRLRRQEEELELLRLQRQEELELQRRLGAAREEQELELQRRLGAAREEQERTRPTMSSEERMRPAMGTEERMRPAQDAAPEKAAPAALLRHVPTPARREDGVTRRKHLQAERPGQCRTQTQSVTRPHSVTRTPPTTASDRGRPASASRTPKTMSPRTVQPPYQQECVRQPQTVYRGGYPEQHGDLAVKIPEDLCKAPPKPSKGIAAVGASAHVETASAGRACASFEPVRRDRQPQAMPRPPSYQQAVPGTAGVSSHRPVPPRVLDGQHQQHHREGTPYKRGKKPRSLSARAMVRSPVRTPPASARTPTRNYCTPLRAIRSQSVLPTSLSFTPNQRSPGHPAIYTPMASTSADMQWVWHARSSGLPPTPTHVREQCCLRSAPDTQVVLTAVPTPARSSFVRSPMKMASTTATTVRVRALTPQAALSLARVSSMKMPATALPAGASVTAAMPLPGASPARCSGQPTQPPRTGAARKQATPTPAQPAALQQPLTWVTKRAPAHSPAPGASRKRCGSPAATHAI